MVRLFDIAAELESLLNSSVDENGEISEESIAALDALEMQRDEKCLAIAAYALGQEAEADAVKAHADKLARRAQIHRNHASRLRAYIAQHLPAGHACSDFRVRLGWRKSTAVRVTDEGKLPEQFWRVTREPALSDIKDALKAGESVDGAELEPRNNLVIR
jgi:hypothetical protein